MVPRPEYCDCYYMVAPSGLWYRHATNRCPVSGHGYDTDCTPEERWVRVPTYPWPVTM